MQEFALGRAIAQRPYRTRPVAGAPERAAAGPSDDALSEFVSAFKQMASQLDENGAKDLLKWSPLFMPSMQAPASQHSSGQGTERPGPSCGCG